MFSWALQIWTIGVTICYHFLEKKKQNTYKYILKNKTLYKFLLGFNLKLILPASNLGHCTQFLGSLFVDKQVQMVGKLYQMKYHHYKENELLILIC